jgi:hypothetical protein
MAALTTASAAPDSAATSTSPRYAINPAANTTLSAQTSQQHIALLIVPGSASTTTRPQVRDWNDPQPAQQAVGQAAEVKSSPATEGSLVLPVVNVHSQPTVLKYISLKVKDLFVGTNSPQQ